VTWGFVEGRVYNRRLDIHGRFRGQQQGGIITPSDRKFPIIIITGAEGGAHGYDDRQRADGTFEYFGEGQVGNMEMVRGNEAIRSHSETGRDLLLFRKQRDGLRYLGQFVFENFHIEDAPDTTGQMRNAIVFELRPFEAVETAEDQAGEIAHGNLDLRELRRMAIDAASSNPRRGERLASVFERSRLICAYVFARANGICECCGSPAPFSRVDGTPYLEAHHIRRLTDGGPDDPRTMIGVCPNCHRRAHSGGDRTELNDRMLRIVSDLERRR
jgi:5-methylcytosine-specific restriction protein A